MLRRRMFQLKLLLYPVLYFVFAGKYLKIRMIDNHLDFMPYTIPFFLAFGSLTIAMLLLVDLLWSFSVRDKVQNIVISVIYFAIYAELFFRVTPFPRFDKLLWYFSLQALLIMVVLACIILRLLLSKDQPAKDDGMTEMSAK